MARRKLEKRISLISTEEPWIAPYSKHPSDSAQPKQSWHPRSLLSKKRTGPRKLEGPLEFAVHTPPSSRPENMQPMRLPIRSGGHILCDLQPNVASDHRLLALWLALFSWNEFCVGGGQPLRTNDLLPDQP